MTDIRLSPLYLQFAREKEHPHEAILRDFAASTSNVRVLVLHAPTGAGKTRTVMRLAQERGGVLITVPTNALAAEIKEAYAAERPGRVAQWVADAFVKRNRDRHAQMIEDGFDKEFVVSNPDMLHLFTQHELVPAVYRERLSGFGMKGFNLLVFDEYHAYDERVLAAVLLYVLKSRAARDTNHRFVFMSATPDETLTGALQKLGIAYECPGLPDATPKSLAPAEGRLIKGELLVTVTADPIAADVSRPADRTLYVFNSWMDQQRAARGLRRLGLTEDDTPGGFVEITGRKTQAGNQKTWNKASILLATSKVDVGLNIDDLARVVMEPGWSEQQFWQRFGRAGRGRNAEVVLHFTGAPTEQLAEVRRSDSYDGLARAIRPLLKSTDRNVSTVLRYVGAYAASYAAHTPDGVHDHELVRGDALPESARQAFGIVRTLFSTWDRDPLRDGRGGAEAWARRVRASLRGIRGRSLQVPVRYWGEGEPFLENLVFVLTRTVHTKEKDGVYEVNEFRTTPSECRLTYSLPDGAEVSLRSRGRIDWREFRKLSGRLREAVDDSLREDGLPPFWDALAAWLAIARPDDVAPEGVDPDDSFL